MEYHLSLTRYLQTMNRTINDTNEPPYSRAVVKQYLLMIHQHDLKYLINPERDTVLFTIRYENQGGQALQRWGRMLEQKAVNLLPEANAFATGRALLVVESSRQLARSQLYVVGGGSDSPWLS